MIREGALIALAAAVALLATRGDARRDDFDRGLCVGACPGARWALAQQENGRVAVLPAPARPGRALLAAAGPKRGRVAKADLVARIAPAVAGRTVTVAFDLRAPAGTPLDSLQIADVECATCGEGGNPGVRLYLRRGRLRVDRSKIGVRHAWTNEAAPTLARERWHRIVYALRLGDEARGGVRVTLDGAEVLRATGRTLPAGGDHVDRVQIGITAYSNAVPARLWFDDVAIRID